MAILYARCAGLDIHRDTIVAYVRLAEAGGVVRFVETFATTTAVPSDGNCGLCSLRRLQPAVPIAIRIRSVIPAATSPLAYLEDRPSGVRKRAYVLSNRRPCRRISSSSAW